ncbi:unnamed protein product [Cercospora beticola]|nr:unnamed protein product [Cercospora beticola]
MRTVCGRVVRTRDLQAPPRYFGHTSDAVLHRQAHVHRHPARCPSHISSSALPCHVACNSTAVTCLDAAALELKAVIIDALPPRRHDGVAAQVHQKQYTYADHFYAAARFSPKPTHACRLPPGEPLLEAPYSQHLPNTSPSRANISIKRVHNSRPTVVTSGVTFGRKGGGSTTLTSSTIRHGQIQDSSRSAVSLNN